MVVTTVRCGGHDCAVWLSLGVLLAAVAAAGVGVGDDVVQSGPGSFHESLLSHDSRFNSRADLHSSPLLHETPTLTASHHPPTPPRCVCAIAITSQVKQNNHSPTSVLSDTFLPKHNTLQGAAQPMSCCHLHVRLARMCPTPPSTVHSYPPSTSTPSC